MSMGTRKRRWRIGLGGIIAIGLAAAGPPGCGPDMSGSEGGLEAGSDVVVPDARPDAMVGMDAGPEAGAEAGTDAGMDVSSDVADAQNPADAGDGAVNDAGDGGMPNLIPTLYAQCGSACSSPLDAVLTADGQTVFFTAFTPAGEGALFRVTMGQTPTMVVGGYEYPVAVAISNDSSTVFVADMTATRAAGGTGPESAGAIYSVNVTSMVSTELNVGTAITQIAALALSADGTRLIISARDGSGVPGVFSVQTSGSAATMIAMGGAFSDPSGIGVASDGSLFVHDLTAGGARAAAVVRVAAGTSNTMLQMPRLVANYPAGLALSMDNSWGLLAGASDDPGNGLLTIVNTASMATNASPALSVGMVSPTGIHRARNSNTFVIADDTANTSGSIFLLR